MPGSLSFCLEGREDNQGDSATPSADQLAAIEDFSALRDASLSPGSGYSLGDYAPMSSLITTSSKSAPQRSPPREREKLMVRPGKMMKEAHFKSIG